MAPASDMTKRPLGPTGLMVSEAGFGGYRVTTGIPEQHEALSHALLGGINLIDTSSNYADGGSEKLVGNVLAELVESGKLKRKDVVLVTKAGYVQGRNLKRAEERSEAGDPFPELVDFAEGLQHCIHPEFLADQLERAIKRLGQDYIDVFLLHNPEYHLSWCDSQGMDRDQVQTEYYRRIKEAFAFLETQVEAGRIGWYGISSNTFVDPEEAYAHTSLSKVWELARSLTPQNHFAVVQFPLNLYESGAVLEKNQPGGQSVLKFAAEKGLGVLINRPLNAINGERLTRLAEQGDVVKPEKYQVANTLISFKDSEDQIMRSLVPNLGLAHDQEQKTKEQLALAFTLLQNWENFAGLEHFKGVRSGWAVPRLNAVAGVMVRILADRQEALSALDAHLKRAQSALDVVEDWYKAEANQLNQGIISAVKRAEPRWARAGKLSRMAIRALRSTHGVTSVLVGMRQKEYVEDVLAELARPVKQNDNTPAWRALDLPLEPESRS